jgi:hypothetical protein
MEPATFFLGIRMIVVAGSFSMGKLRLAELARNGMVGCIELGMSHLQKSLFLKNRGKSIINLTLLVV